ncbi:MAG TPA: hypothetical protein VN428_07615 [Bryobacteraceae bacterium]|nr:hypothetical protein [Bryobacteraceae bacterium]
MSIEIRERPRCCRNIIKNGLRPHLDSKGQWDGHGVQPDGEEVFQIGGMRAQMRKMIQEGYWEDLAGDLAKRGTASRIGGP